MTPKRFITRAVEIEAVLFDGTNFEELADWTGGFQKPQKTEHEHTDITAEVWNFLHRSWVGVKDGQWIVRGNKGEFYPLDAETLAWNYKEVSTPGNEELDDALQTIKNSIASIHADAEDSKLYDKARIDTLEEEAKVLEGTRAGHELTERQQQAVDVAQSVAEEDEGGTVPKEDFERNWKQGTHE